MNSMNGMNALLAKDFRLSLDTLLPWGLIVAGFGVIAAGLSRLPESMAPDVLGRLTLVDAIFYTGIVVGLTAIAVGAWVAAVVAQGDRIHGAEHLMAALPVSAWWRAGSKLCAVAVGAAVPAVVATLCFALGGAMTERFELPPGELWLPLVATGGAAFSGAALGLGVSPIVRGPFRVVAIALLLGALGGLLGLFASWTTFDRAVADLIAFVPGERDVIPPQNVDLALGDSRTLAAVFATIAGIATTALIALGVGAFALVRARRPGRVLAALGAGLVLALGAGAVATFISFDMDDGLRRTPEWAHWQAAKSDDGELIQRLRSANQKMAVGGIGVVDQVEMASLVEIKSRLERVDPAVRGEHPLMKAIMAAQDSSTERHAVWWVWLLPFGSESVERSVDAARRYPKLRRSLLAQLIHAGPAVEGRDALDDADPSANEQERHRRFDEVARRSLRALQDKYPAQHETIQALLDEMGSPAGS